MIDPQAAPPAEKVAAGGAGLIYAGFPASYQS
jgi:hypothetical protein